MTLNQDKLCLVVPSMAYEGQLLDYKRETLAIEDEMAGDAGLDTTETVAEWLERLSRCAHPDTCPAGMMPASTYLCVRTRDDRLVGLVDIRHRLNDNLLKSGGHIGYSIRPDERGRGYAKMQLLLALDKCRSLGISPVLITCAADNEASKRTIVACGGVLDDMRISHEGRHTLRYWVHL